MRYVFGPVPSRRLGQSLGIDPVPIKTCNWNCIYCQLGRTQPITNERLDYFPPEDIIAQVKDALKDKITQTIDWISFIGSGETTLHASLGKMIKAVKSLTDIPIAVITNGSLLYLPQVRQELVQADAVLPSLDGGNAVIYHRINRPYPSLTFTRLVEGLTSFRKIYQGKLWVEVMLVKGMNDTEKALIDLAATLTEIRPDEIHLIQPTRPPAETWVNPPDEEGLQRARAILGQKAIVVHPASGCFEFNEGESLLDAILGIITRHPMRESELVETLSHWSVKDVRETLKSLSKSGRAQLVTRYGVRFWTAQEGHYARKKAE